MKNNFFKKKNLNSPIAIKLYFLGLSTQTVKFSVIFMIRFIKLLMKLTLKEWP